MCVHIYIYIYTYTVYIYVYIHTMTYSSTRALPSHLFFPFLSFLRCGPESKHVYFRHLYNPAEPCELLWIQYVANVHLVWLKYIEVLWSGYD